MSFFAGTASQSWALRLTPLGSKEERGGPGLAGRDASDERLLLPKCRVSLPDSRLQLGPAPPGDIGEDKHLSGVSGRRQASPWVTLSSRISTKSPRNARCLSSGEQRAEGRARGESARGCPWPGPARRRGSPAVRTPSPERRRRARWEVRGSRLPRRTGRAPSLRARAAMLHSRRTLVI